MSKISNALLMLFYLNNKNTYIKISELSNYLEVSDREIRRYRDDLEMAGFSIENKTGRYGGYLLTNDVVLSMNMNHMRHLLEHHLNENKSFHLCQDQMSDIIQSLKNDHYISNYLFDKDLIDQLVQINLSIKLRYQIEIDYLTSKGMKVKQVVEPYLIKNVRDVHYLFAMHEGILKSYAIKQISSIDQLNKPYVINHQIFQKEKNEHAYGVYRSEKKYTIRFRVYGRMNQFVYEIFKGHARKIEEEEVYEIDTYNLHEILYPFLSFGASLKIISPDLFIKHLKKELDKIKNNY
jgi:predicted DNA-binding transcriptional regulator YafY